MRLTLDEKKGKGTVLLQGDILLARKQRVGCGLVALLTKCQFGPQSHFWQWGNLGSFLPAVDLQPALCSVPEGPVPP